jgi:hypothetical protein
MNQMWTGINGGNPWIARNSNNNRARMDLIELFEGLAHRFTAWEANFAKSLKEQHEKGGIGCTYKQAQVAEKIINSVNGRVKNDSKQSVRGY